MAPVGVAFFLTAGILAVVHLMVDPPMLLAERFLPGGGWIEIAMLAWSARAGFMAHCTWFCPMGALACRYGALSPADIDRRKPGPTCTLCGDCVGRCRSHSAGYGFWPLRGEGVRAAFIALVVALHAVFLGVARV